MSNIKFPTLPFSNIGLKKPIRQGMHKPQKIPYQDRHITLSVFMEQGAYLDFAQLESCLDLLVRFIKPFIMRKTINLAMWQGYIPLRKAK